ncbi:MAG: conjugal transfer protein TraF [Janthinobacterium lividum]
MKYTQGCAALLLIALGAGGAAHAQTAPTPAPIGPSQIDRTQFRASARAMGMGGTDLLLMGDVSSAAFNPAAIAFAGPSSESNTAAGSTSNVNVNKINDLSNGIKDLGDQFNNSNSSLAGVRDAFQKIYNFATGAGANESGSPADLTANLAPLIGVNVRNVGIVAYGSLSAKVELRAYNQASLGTNFTNLGSPSGAETAAYGVLGLTNIAVPFSIKTPIGAIGISPRYVQASYAGAGFLANETSTANGFDTTGAPNGDIAGATYREVQQSKFDVDLGYISNPDPLYHIRGAIAVHNLLSPTFHLPQRLNSSLGAVPASGDFSFGMKPQVDVGGLGAYHGVTYAAELHNLGSVNGGKRSVHLGLDYPVSRGFSLRGGYDQSRFVAGLGFGFGGVQIDLATSTDPQQQVALSLIFGGR